MQGIWAGLSALAALAVVIFIVRSIKKAKVAREESLADFMPNPTYGQDQDINRDLTFLDPLDNSPLGDVTEDIHIIRHPSGKIMTVRVNRHNADILRRKGLKAFPKFEDNLKGYAHRYRNYYRRTFRPFDCYLIDGDYGFDPIMWWIWYDIFFGFNPDSPEFTYDPLFPDVDQDYRELYEHNLENLREQNDPAGLEAYLMSSAPPEEPASRFETPDSEPVRQHEAPEIRREETDPLSLSPYLESRTETVREEAPTVVHEEQAAAVETETVSEPSSSDSNSSADTGGGGGGD